MAYPPLRPSRPFGLPNTPFNPMTGKFFGFRNDEGGSFTYEGPFKVVDITGDDNVLRIRVEDNGNRVIINGKVFPCPIIEKRVGDHFAPEGEINYTGVYLNLSNPPYYTLNFKNFGEGGEETGEEFYLQQALLAKLGITREGNVNKIASISQTQFGEISRGSVMYPAQVLSKSGAFHNVRIFRGGISGAPGEEAKVGFVQLDLAEEIPAYTWILVHQTTVAAIGSGDL